MADFIAVIRRAVDGLSDNTPEMRVRVYDKARAAVQRQLENMKPRPTDDMLRRQLDKLEAAIRQVEEEHAEALPALEDSAAPEAAAPVMATPLPVPETEPEPQPEPGYHEQPSAVVEEAPRAPVEAVVAAPVAAPEVFAAPAEPAPIAFEPAPMVEAPAATVSAWDAPFVEAPAQPAASTEADIAAPVEPGSADPLSSFIETLPAESVIAAPPVVEAAAETAWPVDVDSEPETWVDPDATPVVAATPEPVSANLELPQETPDVRMPRADFDEARALGDFGDLLSSAPAPVVAPPVAESPVPPRTERVDFWDAPFDDLPDLGKPVTTAPAMPDAAAIPVAPPQPAITGDLPPGTLDDLPPRDAVRSTDGSKDPLAELDELIGFTRPKSADAGKPGKAQRNGTRKTGKTGLPPEVSDAVSKLEGKSFRTQPQKGRSLVIPIAIAAALVVVAGGAGAGIWYNADTLSKMIGLSGTPAEETAKADPAKDATATPDKPLDNAGTEDGKPADKAKVEEAATPDEPATEVAALSPDAAGTQKFTQRLMEDGSELGGDEILVDGQLPEGKTVAGQTEKGKAEVALAATEATSTDAKPADNATIGVAQKLYLYEEQIGQGTPVAVEGTVAWAEKTDGNTNGKPEPVIEGRLELPDRQTTAVVTIKRNTDASLPASHLVEIVFALPKDFEGGNVESVDRIAFKPTEQTIGNALVAVPAKITDDFHMVALNADKDAVTRNLELMRTRPWIDIPVTYRNGRKALFTLEKGTTGAAVFDKVLSEWAALGPAASN